MKEGEIRNEVNIVSKPPWDGVLQQIYYASSDGRSGVATKRQDEGAPAPELIRAQNVAALVPMRKGSLNSVMCELYF